jgi:hypothetical protein
MHFCNDENLMQSAIDQNSPIIGFKRRSIGVRWRRKAFLPKVQPHEAQQLAHKGGSQAGKGDSAKIA